MLSAVAALVLSQDKTGISSGAGQTTVATAKGSNPATDTYPGSVPPDAYVLTDAGIDTTCTDIDFDDADVTVSNLGGTDHCCTWCEGSASSKYLCCPTAAPGGGTDIVRVPHDVKNARQILDKDYMMYNTCHGSPDAALGTPSSKTNTDPVIKPHEGSTSYLKLSGVQVDPTAPPINLIVKNTTTYIPAWPRLGDCYEFKNGQRNMNKPNECEKGADFAQPSDRECLEAGGLPEQRPQDGRDPSERPPPGQPLQ
jgi:hypothetical protein